MGGACRAVHPLDSRMEYLKNSKKWKDKMSALGHKRTFFDYPQNVRFRG